MIEEYIKTPFGLIPNPVKEKFIPHWLFAHLFDEDGNVK